jgi:hypothetical protein
MIQILKKAPGLRRQNEVDQLLPYVKGIKYFAEKPEIKENDYIFICEHARYEMVPHGRNIINVGKRLKIELN